MMTTEERLTSLETKFELFMQEIREQREDIRRLQDRQDEDRRKHDADMKDMNARFDAKFDTIDAKFDRLSEQIHTMTIAAVVGFGAIAAAVGSLIIAKFK